MTFPKTAEREIVELTETLLRAYARIAEQEAFEDNRVHLVPGATEAHWPAIEASFAAARVPLDPGLRVLYGRTLGLLNPICHMPVLVPPFEGADIREDAVWEHSGLDGFMDSLHLWPLEEIEEDEEAFAFLVIGTGFDASLTVDDRGSWSTKPYHGDGGPFPERADFTLSFVQAFRIFVDRCLVEWACASLEDHDAWRSAALDPAALPEEVRAARERLVAPLDLDVLPLAEIRGFRGPAPAEPLEAPQPRPQSGSDGCFSVVGLPFADYDRVQSDIRAGVLLRLRPVDDNPHDAQAVEVWFDGSAGPARVGFVPRGLAPEVRERMASREWQPTVKVRHASLGQLVIEEPVKALLAERP